MSKANLETGLKVCPKCGIEKPIGQFHVSRRNKDGLQYVCKNCNCVATKSWVENNKDKAKESRKAWKENNKDYMKNWRENNKDKVEQYGKNWRENNRVYRKNYRETNKDKIKQYSKKYYENNRDKVNQIGKAWRENNKNKMNQLNRGLYEKYKKMDLCVKCGSELMENSKLFCEKCWFKSCSYGNLGSNKHWEHLKNLFEQQNRKCYWSTLDLILGVNASIDHIKPVSEYPDLARDLDNVCWCDDSTNKSKGNRDPDEFKEELDTYVFYDRKDN